MSEIIYKCSASVLESKIDDEVVLMSVDKGFYYGLEPVASRIWEIVSASPSSLKDICKVLMEEYDIDEENCKAETLSFLDILIEQGLLQKVAV